MAEVKKSSAAKKAPAKEVAKKAQVKKTVKKEDKVVTSPIEQILDPTNNENIFLFNDEKQVIEFEQIALIPYADEVYVILKPVGEFDDIADDEAVVFQIVEEKNGEVYLDSLDSENDNELIDVIFDIYYKLFEEATKSKK